MGGQFGQRSWIERTEKVLSLLIIGVRISLKSLTADSNLPGL